MSDAHGSEREQLRRAYEAGYLDEKTYRDLISKLDEELSAQVDSGAAASGQHSTALGERAVQAQRSELIISGDNNSVQMIIHRYDPQGKKVPDEDALRAQIGRYLTWLQAWAGTLELRGIQRQGEQVVQLPLQQVYVPLAATAYGSRSNAINLNQILAQDRRLILTGGPGSGKTTVLLHIAWALSHAMAADDLQIAAEKVGFSPAKWKIDNAGKRRLARQKEKPDEREALPLPIFVPLSAYALHRRGLTSKDDRTLAAFISQYLFDRQTSFALPNDFFRTLLRGGQSVLLLLDGLDEVPNEAERAQVRQAIEDLVTGRDWMRVVVTCRTAAYQGRTALGKGFREISVRPLAQQHVTALVEHAYAHLYRTDPLLEKEKTEELLSGIAQLEAERRQRLGDKATRLIDSPLLVRMLLIVHYRERRLPQQRAELYMKATDAMLLPDYAPDTETADHIGRLVGGSWEVHRDMVQHLAFHMHRRGEQQGREIEEAELRRILEAEPAYAPLVADFISLTRLRGTLLEERLGRYRFLHLAFQEFLTARYLAEIVRSEGGIEAVVAFLEEGPLLESWWREVILLIAGYFSVTSPQSAQAFLERLARIDAAAGNRAALPSELQLTAAELAAIAWLEWPAQRATLRHRLAQRLVAILANGDLVDAAPLPLRASAGRTLGQLGDPRPGVGIDAETGLPDIVWGAEIPAGTYKIGGTKPREVKISRPFRLARYPITNAQFQAFVDAADQDRSMWWEGLPDGEKEFSNPQFPHANHPRERVSWYQAVAFCRWLTAKLHVGALSATQLDGDPTQYVITLPHEYEWEVAARWPNEDVQQRIYPWGPKFDAAKANTSEGKRVRQTTAVGIYPSGQNAALELYDLGGNVWEWCRNRYNEPEQDAGPNQLDVSGARRVLRGGSWLGNQAYARAVYRLTLTPGRGSNYGFRVVAVRRSPSHHLNHCSLFPAGEW